MYFVCPRYSKKPGEGMGDDIFSILKLDANPFSSSACTKGYFHTANTKRILEELHHGIRSRKGFLVLVGEVGVGKTSLLYQFLHSLEGEKLATAWVFNTLLDRKELLLAIARDYDLEADEKTNLARLIEALHRFFLDRYAKGYNCAIIVDEAHNLSPETLEALRMLSNLEKEGEKLVQILLVGQPELKEKLDQPNLRQLRSRVGIFLTMDPLDREETSRYVQYKLASVGAEIPVTKAAVARLWKATGGNSRMVNLIMERALYGLVANGASDVNRKIMDEALGEIASYQIEVAERLGLGKQRKHLIWLGAAASVLLVLGLGFFMFFTPNSASKALTGTSGPIASDAALPKGKPEFQVKADIPPAVPHSSGPTLEPTPKTPVPAASEPTTLAKESSGQTTLAALAPPDALPDAAEQTASPQAPQTAEPKSHPESHVAFLKPFGLENLLPVLDQALRQNNPSILEQQLPAGVQLILLQDLPPQGNVHFTALSWNHPGGEKTLESPKWIALWKPVLAIDQFYPGLKSKDINELQWMLRNMGYYHGPVDATVGPLTWQAINNFQKDWPMARTGAPTRETIFWIAALYQQP